MSSLNYAVAIKNAIKFKDAARRYGMLFDRSGFARCPFHNEKTASFAIKKEKGHCFGCGWHGDIIDFVSALFGISFIDAMQKLSDDFALGLSIKAGQDKLSDLERSARNKLIELERSMQNDRIERERLQREYENALFRWIYFDKIKQKQTPSCFLDDITDDYVTACKEIDEASYRLDEALSELWKFEATH